MRVRIGTLLLAVATLAPAQQHVTFPLSTSNAIQLQADLYGTGTRAVLLAHGVRFHKESWQPQALALQHSGFLVLALSFRGDRLNPDGSPGSFGTDPENAQDILAAVAYLQHQGVRQISAVGASFGGDAVGNAAAESPPGTFHRIVFLAAGGGDHPEKVLSPKLFILARDDRSGSGPRLPEISAHYARAPQPKRLVLLDGAAHAQFLFSADQGPRLLKEITDFLNARP